MIRTIPRALLLITLFCCILANSNCPDDKQCQTCSGSKCIRCHNGYYPNDKGICEEVEEKIKNCSVYAPDQRCSFCDFNYYVSDDECVDIPIEGCAFNNNVSENCWVCENRIAVQNNSCSNKSVKCKDANCELCLWGPDICFLCKKGFAPISGLCILFDDNCGEIDPKDSSKCKTCINGYNKNGVCVNSAANFMTKVIVLLKVMYMVFK